MDSTLILRRRHQILQDGRRPRRSSGACVRAGKRCKPSFVTDRTTRPRRTNNPVGDDHRSDIQHAIGSCPAALRRLLEAELAAGNYVIKITSTRSTSSDRLRIYLAKLVTTRPRAGAPDIVFAPAEAPGAPGQRSVLPGEFSDPERRFVVVEDPREPSAEPDMDAIRASLQAIELLANTDRFRPDGGLW